MRATVCRAGAIASGQQPCLLSRTVTVSLATSQPGASAERLRLHCPTPSYTTWNPYSGRCEVGSDRLRPIVAHGCMDMMRDPVVTLQAATCECLVRHHTYHEWQGASGWVGEECLALP